LAYFPGFGTVTGPSGARGSRGSLTMDGLAAGGADGTERGIVLPPGNAGVLPPGTGGTLPPGTGGILPPGTDGVLPPGTDGAVPTGA
jgi:hypothetical protein